VVLGSCMRQESGAFIAWARAWLLTHTCWACKSSLSPSPHSYNLLPLAYKRESMGPLHAGWRGASFFNLQSPAAQKLQRLGSELPLSSICNPYYKSVQITQQHELDVGCYSPEARTSINSVYLPFAQPSETRHAIRQIYLPAVT
jgi:hypothetical protein